MCFFTFKIKLLKSKCIRFGYQINSNILYWLSIAIYMTYHPPILDCLHSVPIQVQNL